MTEPQEDLKDFDFYGVEHIGEGERIPPSGLFFILAVLWLSSIVLGTWLVAHWFWPF